MEDEISDRSMAKPKPFVVKAKVWRFPGMGGWHFVYVDKEVGDTAVQRAKGKKFRNGLIPIWATVGETTWRTALLPYKKEDTYLIALKADVRRKEGVFEGDAVKISFIPAT